MGLFRDGLGWFIDGCVRSRLMRLTLNYLGLRPALRGLLRVLPVYNRVPRSPLVFRITSAADLLTSRELFRGGEYDALRELGPIGSFVDAGCNCGYFTLFAASLGQPHSVSALAIDAHPDMVAATQWHLDRNGLTGIRAVWGLLGSQQAEHDIFFMHVDSPGSSRIPVTPDINVTPRPWRSISVPTMSLAEEWQKHFGNMGCDILKIDIEGSELDLIRHDQRFLFLASAILVEIHKWLISVPELESALRKCHFARYRFLREDHHVCIALYLNRHGRFAHLLDSTSLTAT